MLPSAIEAITAANLPKLKDVSIRFNGTLALDGISLDFETGLTTLLICARGCGQSILNGMRLDDAALILDRAVSAAPLAILVQGLLDLADRQLVPRGLGIDLEGAVKK